MRKRATDGTKISTSLTITKKMVRTRRRAERLLSSTIPLASTEPRQQPDQSPGAWREQGRGIITSRRALARLPAGRPGQDQISGPGAEDRGPEDMAVAAGDDLDDPLGLALGLRSVVLDKAPTQ